jgi:ribosomal protein S18 acetylase RimI-like enzyme
MSHVYKIHRLPLSDRSLLPVLAEKFASLRLSALLGSASAFSSTYEIEAGFTVQDWIERLERPLVHNFIAVAYEPGSESKQQTIDGGDWVGSATLLGSYPKSSYILSDSGGPEPGEDDVESKWQMTAVYNSPEHRGKGIAKMLIQSAVEFASKEGGNGQRCRTRIMIHPNNVVVKSLYSRLGFVDAGLCTLAEAFLSNGDASLLPADGGASEPEKYHNRLGIVMEHVS